MRYANSKKMSKRASRKHERASGRNPDLHGLLPGRSSFIKYTKCRRSDFNSDAGVLCSTILTGTWWPGAMLLWLLSLSASELRGAQKNGHNGCVYPAGCLH